MKQDNLWFGHIAMIAHDLNGPITAAKGNVELMQLTGPLNEKQQKFAERALVSLIQMEQLVRMLLDVAWLDADKPLDCHEIVVGDIVSQAVTMSETVAARREVTIETDIHPDTGTMMGDPQRLPQVFNNLINNGIKYNHQGGHVWVSASGNADAIEIVVRDNGRGIPAEDLPNLFAQYFRAQPGSAANIDGNGLGLAIVKAVVDKHHGSVTVSSVLGEGTTFRVTLPRRQPQPQVAAASAPPVAEG